MMLEKELSYAEAMLKQHENNVRHKTQLFMSELRQRFMLESGSDPIGNFRFREFEVFFECLDAHWNNKIHEMQLEYMQYFGYLNNKLKELTKKD